MTTRIERTTPASPAPGKLSTLPIRNNATRVTVSTFGVRAGLAGIEHGIGEVLQGNRAPDGLMILSWPDWEVFRILAGEPAMTLVPNLLVTGILAIIASLIFLTWVTVFIQRKQGGLVLILLSLVMLLLGGGVGPPLLGLILGATATRLQAPLTWWRSHLPRGARRFLSTLWPWAFGAGLIAWLALLPGSILFDYLIGMPNPDVTIAVLTLSAFGMLLVTIVAALARDTEQQMDAEQDAVHGGGSR